MTARHPSRLRQRYRATFALIAFVVATLVGLLAPVVEGHAYQLVCSAQGNRFVSLDASADPGEAPALHDHAAHCPLCMPVGAPPSELVWDFTPVQVDAPAHRGIPASRVVGLVGAPLPARGPPFLS